MSMWPLQSPFHECSEARCLLDAEPAIKATWHSHLAADLSYTMELAQLQALENYTIAQAVDDVILHDIVPGGAHAWGAESV